MFCSSPLPTKYSCNLIRSNLQLYSAVAEYITNTAALYIKSPERLNYAIQHYIHNTAALNINYFIFIFCCPSLHIKYSYTVNKLSCTAKIYCPSIVTQYRYTVHKPYLTVIFYCPSISTQYNHNI